MTKRLLLVLLLPGLLAPGLGQLAVTLGWTHRPDLVVGVLFIVCAVVLVGFRGTIPLVQALVPGTVLLAAGLALLGIVSIPGVPSTSLGLAAVIIFLLIDLNHRRPRQTGGGAPERRSHS